MVTYQGTGKITSSPGSANANIAAANAILHPVVKLTSSAVTSVSSPYTTFISSANALLRANVPAIPPYFVLIGSAEILARAEKNSDGGGIPSTPWERFRRGLEGVGVNDLAQMLAWGMLGPMWRQLESS